ncbi:glycosyltransferase [uncultured Selenomonas sp.]|uniref:glycosyltransferase n=1 Tax=uncultured Selenomonas sp. TaxID=159275 RepID=UPI0025F5BB35|nr:glycosyltransferase [uncultured Selenomonas sp.]
MHHLLKKSWQTVHQDGMRAFLRKAYHHLHRKGDAAPDVAATYEALRRAEAPAYRRWLDAQRPSAEALRGQAAAVFPEMPLISIVVPVYNTEPRYLQALADSIFAQSYGRWELLLVDGCSTRPETLALLDKLAAADSRIHMLHLPENLGISGNTNRGIERAAGSYIAFSDHDDTWEPDALYEVVRAIHDAPAPADVIYTDEDKIDESGTLYYEPHRKPDYSPEKLQSCNYMNHLTVLSRAVLDRVGFLRSGFDGSQDHELVLRACDAARAVCHVPRVLYHWRQFSASMSKQHLEACQAAGRRAVAEHLARIGLPGMVTQDHGYRIAFETPADARMDEITVDLAHPHLYAALHAAAQASSADYLLFRDARLVPAGDGAWQKELLMYAQQDAVGCVTGKLLLPAGDAICMTNWLLAPDGPRPEFHGHSLGVIGPGGRERIVRNIAAAPLPFLFVRRAAFLAVGGFDASYDRAFGDIDLCTRMRARGLRHVYTPYAVLRFASAPDDFLTLWAAREGADWERFAADSAHFQDDCSRLPFDEEPADASAGSERNPR